MSSSSKSAVEHYMKKIQRHLDNPKTILYCLEKLDATTVTIAILQETGVGKIINGLRKKVKSDDVIEASKTLVQKWKDMVANAEDENDGNESHGDAEEPPQLEPEREHSRHSHRDDKKSKHSSNGDKDNKKSKHKEKKHSKASTKPADDFASALDIPIKKYATKESKRRSAASTSASDDVVEVPSDINPNYRPSYKAKAATNSSRPTSNGFKSANNSDDDALSAMMAMAKSSRNMTKVYSGKKTSAFAVGEKFPTLQELCIHVLQDNVDLIDECGSASYDIMKPVLERAKPDDLMRIESYNPRFMEESGELWKKICQRQFAREKRQELESYREMYERCVVERDAKLTKLTAKVQNSYKDIKSNQSQTRLAYVDGVAKPPRGVKRAQERHGTGLPAGTPMEMAKAKKARTSGNPPTPSASTSSASNKKPKVAPMMAKTLKLARGLKVGFRR